MSNALLTLLGNMIVDSGFRGAMKVNAAGALASRGFVLTAGEHIIAAKIVAGFKKPDIITALDAFDGECPNWPCGNMKLVGHDDVAVFYQAPPRVGN